MKKFNSVITSILSILKKWGKNEFLVASIALVAFILLFFSPIFIQGKIPSSSSYILDLYPWVYYRDQYKSDQIANPILSDEYDAQIPRSRLFIEEFWNGNYPLWDPYVVSGRPFGLLFISDNFSILRLATILAGVQWGRLLYLFLKMYTVGIFFYLYMRYRDNSWQAAILGSLVLMFSASMIANAMRDVVDAVIYAPAILYFAERFVCEKKYRYFLGVVFMVGLALISGFPSVTMYVLLLVGIYLTFRILIELKIEKFRERMRNLLWVYIALGIGVVWVAFTFLPTIEYLQFINLGYREGRGPTTLPRIAMARMLNPNICGQLIAGKWYCGGNESAIYVGILPLILVPFSVAHKKQRTTSLFFITTTILVLMTVFGIASLNKLVGNLPLFKINPNTRMIALLPFCFAFITTIGIDNILLVMFGRKERILSIIYFLLILVVTAYSLSIVNSLFNENQGGYFRNQLLFAFLLLSSYILIILLIIFNRMVIKPALLTLILLSLGSQVFLLGDYQGSSYPDNFYPETEATTFLKTELPSYERVVIIGRHFIPSLPQYYLINSLTGHSHASMEFKQNMELISPGIYSGNTTQPRFNSSTINLLSPLLDLYRVRFVVTPPDDPLLWHEVLANQNEYNSSYELDNAISFGQSIVINRDGNMEYLAVNINIPDTESFPVLVKVYENDHLIIEDNNVLVKQNDGRYIIDLPTTVVEKGQSIRFEIIAADENFFPKDSVLRTVNYDIYRSGSLYIDGKEIGDRDIAFRLYQLNPLIAEKYSLVHKGDLNIYKNNSLNQNLPIVTELTYSATNNEICADNLNQINPFKAAVVDDSQLKISTDVGQSTAWIESYGTDEVVINAVIDEPEAMVILSDTYYPGWDAKVDGVPTKLYLVNCAMRGIVVPQGTHTVTMSYRPLSFIIGAIISIITIAGLMVGGIIINRRFKG